MPLDTIKTIMQVSHYSFDLKPRMRIPPNLHYHSPRSAGFIAQVEGKQGIPKLRAKIRTGGPLVMCVFALDVCSTDQPHLFVS